MSYARLFTFLWIAMSPKGTFLAGIDRHDVGIRVQQARRASWKATRFNWLRFTKVVRWL
jgi:hypothetical protein